MAKAVFLGPEKIWRHAALTRLRKMEIYVAFVEAKLLYSLTALCLTVAQRRRINGFHDRCIRKVKGIQPSFISRVSNAAV